MAITDNRHWTCTERKNSSKVVCAPGRVFANRIVELAQDSQKQAGNYSDLNKRTQQLASY